AAEERGNLFFQQPLNEALDLLPGKLVQVLPADGAGDGPLVVKDGNLFHGGVSFLYRVDARQSSLQEEGSPPSPFTHLLMVAPVRPHHLLPKKRAARENRSRNCCEKGLPSVARRCITKLPGIPRRPPAFSTLSEKTRWIRPPGTLFTPAPATRSRLRPSWSARDWRSIC